MCVLQMCWHACQMIQLADPKDTKKLGSLVLTAAACAFVEGLFTGCIYGCSSASRAACLWSVT